MIKWKEERKEGNNNRKKIKERWRKNMKRKPNEENKGGRKGGSGVIRKNELNGKINVEIIGK